MATKYIARLNNEIVGTRTSKDRTYTHVIVRNQPGQPVKAMSWAGSLRLAQNEANRRTKDSGGWKYEIVPAEVV